MEGAQIVSGSDLNTHFPCFFLISSRLHFSVSAAPAPLSNRMGSVPGTAPALPLCDGHAQSLPPLPHPAGVWSCWCRHAVQLCSGGLQPSIAGWDSTIHLLVIFLYQTEKKYWHLEHLQQCFVLFTIVFILLWSGDMAILWQQSLIGKEAVRQSDSK